MSDSLIYKIFGDDGPLKQTLERVKGHFGGLQSHVTNVSAGITGALGKVNGALAMVTAGLAGGAAIKQSIDATKQLTDQADRLARVLGTNATEAATLGIALGDVYADTEQFTSAAGKLAQELRKNEDGLREMGLQTRNADGSLRPMRDLMLDSIKVVNGYKEGVDRNIAAQRVWGRSAEEFRYMLDLTNETIDAAREKQQALGLVVGVESVEATKAYKAAMNDVGDVVLGVQKAIGDALMPVLTQLATWFSDIGPAAVTTIRVAIGSLVAVFWGLQNAVQIAWDVIAGLIETLTAGLAGVATGFWKILTGDLQGGVAAFQGATEAIKATWEKRVTSMVQSSEQAREKIFGLFTSDTPIASSGRKGGKSAAGLVKDGKDSSQMAAWEAELNALKQAHADKNAAEGTFYEFSKERERTFWQQKRELAAAGTRDAFAVQAKITGATLDLQKDAFEQRLAQLRREESETAQNFARKADLAKQELALIQQRYGAESKQAEDAQRRIQEIERQAQEQRRELRDIEISEAAAQGMHRVELERQRLQFMFDAGLADRAQVLRAEEEFEQQRFQIQQQALLARQAMLDPDKNPVEAARLKQELLEIEQQYQLRLNEIRQQAALENNRYALQGVQTMEQGLTRIFSQIGTQIRTMGQFVQSVFAMIGQTIIGILAQIAARWVAQNILMRVLGKATALGEISAQAGKAGAAGVASWAGAPWPINMGAPAFGAAMSAAAMAYAPMASAAGGFDIPAGVNPITQLHQREMVLPQPQADVIRDLAANGGAGGAGGAPIHVTIHAMDGASVKRVLMDNPAALADALKTATRRGHY